jgi:predicted flap endonuclease-1-like 5' DNA nuclease
VCVASAEIAEAAEGDMPTAEQQLADEPAPAMPAAADASEAANPLIEVATPQVVDDLTRIAGIDAPTAGQLSARGVTAYAQIAAWSAADVAQISEALNIEHRVSKENWIEQAAILAAGGGTAFTRAAAADAPSPVALVEDPNLRPYEHMDDALKANAAAQLAETRIISLQEQRLKRAAQGAAVSPHGVRRRGRYAMATLATGFAASLGFAAVMLFDVDEIRARAAASETLRTLIHHTKRQFEPRPEPRDANATGSDSTSEDPNAQWIHQMQMWPPGA